MNRIITIARRVKQFGINKQIIRHAEMRLPHRGATGLVLVFDLIFCYKKNCIMLVTCLSHLWMSEWMNDWLNDNNAGLLCMLFAECHQSLSGNVSKQSAGDRVNSHRCSSDNKPGNMLPGSVVLSTRCDYIQDAPPVDWLVSSRLHV